MEQTASTKQRIDQLLEALDTGEIAASSNAVEGFARQLLTRASPEFFEPDRMGRVAEEVAALFGFVESTPRSEIGVRVRALPGKTHRAAIETVMPDCPFIVNTLREYLHGRGYSILHLLHPVIAIYRDGEGRITEVRDREAEGDLTSVVYTVIEDRVEAEELEPIREDVRYRLQQVRRATADFERMVERTGEIEADLEGEKERVPWRAAELQEIRELLQWLRDGYFVFLGYRAYDLTTDEQGERWVRVERGSGLGILRDESDSRYYEPQRLDVLPEDLRARVLGGPLLIVSKTNAESPVHRRARMDYVGVKKIGPEGEVRGERRFLGLFTARAYAQDASEIPILRRKLREILQAEEVSRGSHDYNQILQIFNSMPKEELFLSPVSELLNVVGDVMETEGADEVRVLIRPDLLARGVNVIALLPRSRFSEEVREKIQQALLEEYEGELLNYHLAMDGGDQARLHFYLTSGLTELAEVDVGQLEARVRKSVRSWEERLSDALKRTHDADRAHELADRHRGDFSDQYKASIDVDTAVADIEQLDSLDATGAQQLLLREFSPERPSASVLRVFAPRGMYVLSDLMPILENLGLRVIQADAYDIVRPPGAGNTIHTFEVETPPEWGIDRAEASPRLAAGLKAIQDRDAEDDRLNALILSAGLDWRQVAVLRAYGSYAFRIGAATSRAGVRGPLTGYPETARLLYRVFETLHDPAREIGRDAAARKLVDRFQEALESVRSIEHDRTLRRLLALVRATVRTNFFQSRPRGRDPAAVALKIDCDRVEFLPPPRPRYEIFVNGGTTEGAHLRMDRVARGGIRWSQRSEDFRVEVLGLVKTQQVKNSVIVPAGAKGAYIVKRPPEEGEDPRGVGLASYRVFIRALLDLTDNVVGGEVVHPPDMVVRDGNDPYLVVAADKGTTAFSDVANEISAERGYWLGDAFASGGSRGYDHKELGITARGAWECVKRHFRELGVDVREEPFSVVGIGDMSGDVFGNGMLLSRSIRLVAAFDHRHIFLDPDPDPGTSWDERKRLYDLEESTWKDYDAELISAGGGVFERGAKRIPLSAPARELLGVEETEMNGEDLIRAILTAEVDLLWNGGIGTYVKASGETHGQVGDPENDGVRVDASELAARVVGEGGNLGLTQEARVEYALGGGRINTDALDNSGGVDMSDREVNLKILLNAAVDAGRLDRDGRNRLLREITGDVAESVLANSYTQSLAVSLDEYRAREFPAEFRDALVMLEREGVLDRQLEFLPSTEEMLERHEEGSFLSRPELAVVLAHAKMHLKEEVRASGLSDDSSLVELLAEYFPPRAVEAAGEDVLRGHRLRRRIVALQLTNMFVDRMGATSQIELVRETGTSAAEAIRAWYIAYRIGDAESLYARLQEMDYRVPAGVQIQWFLTLSEVLERATRWLLTNSEPGESIGDAIRWFDEPVGELRSALPDLLIAASREELESLRSLHEADGLAPDLAEQMATFEYLDGLLPVAELARQHGLKARRVGEVYFGLTREIDFPWLQARLTRIPGADLWEQRAAKTLSLQLDRARTRISAHIVRGIEDGEDVRTALTGFRREFASELNQIRRVLEDVRSAERPTLASLMVAVHAISNQVAMRNGPIEDAVS